MATKLLEVVTCDFCKTDRPAVNTVLVDVCATHDAKIAERREEALYECEQCGRKLRDPMALRRHVARSHGSEDEDICPYCGKECNGANGVARHIGQKHREEAA